MNRLIERFFCAEPFKDLHMFDRTCDYLVQTFHVERFPPADFAEQYFVEVPVPQITHFVNIYGTTKIYSLPHR